MVRRSDRSKILVLDILFVAKMSKEVRGALPANEIQSCR